MAERTEPQKKLDADLLATVENTQWPRLSDAATTLLDAGADVNAKSAKNGKSVLQLAVDRGNLGLVTLLVERGAHDRVTSDGTDLITWAKTKTQSEELLQGLQTAIQNHPVPIAAIQGANMQTPLEKLQNRVQSIVKVEDYAAGARFQDDGTLFVPQEARNFFTELLPKLTEDEKKEIKTIVAPGDAPDSLNPTVLNNLKSLPALTAWEATLKTDLTADACANLLKLPKLQRLDVSLAVVPPEVMASEEYKALKDKSGLAMNEPRAAAPAPAPAPATAPAPTSTPLTPAETLQSKMSAELKIHPDYAKHLVSFKDGTLIMPKVSGAWLTRFVGTLTREEKNEIKTLVAPGYAIGGTLEDAQTIKTLSSLQNLGKLTITDDGRLSAKTFKNLLDVPQLRALDISRATMEPESLASLEYQRIFDRFNTTEPARTLTTKPEQTPPAEKDTVTLNFTDGSQQRYMKNTPALNLSYLEGKVNNDTLNQLTQFTDLKELSLESTRVTKIDALSKLEGLTTINLGATRVTDLTPLQHLPLTYVSLASTEISSIAPLDGKPLEFIDLRSTGVVNLAPLSGSVKTLEYLGLKDSALFKSQDPKVLESAKTLIDQLPDKLNSGYDRDWGGDKAGMSASLGALITRAKTEGPLAPPPAPKEEKSNTTLIGGLVAGAVALVVGVFTKLGVVGSLILAALVGVGSYKAIEYMQEPKKPETPKVPEPEAGKGPAPAQAQGKAQEIADSDKTNLADIAKAVGLTAATKDWFDSKTVGAIDTNHKDGLNVAEIRSWLLEKAKAANPKLDEKAFETQFNEAVTAKLGGSNASIPVKTVTLEGAGKQ